MLVGKAIRISNGEAQCVDCENSLGPADTNIKENLAVREGPITNAGSTFVDTSRFVDEEMVFREFFCPDCATLLFTETARKGDPILDEFEIEET